MNNKIYGRKRNNNTIRKMTWFIAVMIVLSFGILFSDKCEAEGIDTTAPYVKNVSVGAASIYEGEFLSFTVDLQEEETGLEYIGIMYTKKNGNVTQAMEFSYTFDQPKYSGTISFSTDTIGYVKGTSQICKIYVRDMSGNERTYDNGLFDGTDGHVYSDSGGIYLPEVDDKNEKCLR